MEDDDDGIWVEEAEVMSEVHVGCNPRLSSGVSVFAISSFSPSSEADNARIQEPEGNFVREEEIPEGVDQNPVGTDEHGDLILPRRRRIWKRDLAEVPGDHIWVHHHLSTRLRDVGLQIWKGALLLSDFVLHEMNTTERFRDAIAMELGAGTGLVGLIMARFARLVFITDRGTDILDNCTRNVLTNSNSLKNGETSVRLRELDWHQVWPPENNGLSEGNTTYSWTREDIETCEEASVLLAADVVYSPELTDAFFFLLKKLMPRGCEKILYLSMEKRYNFSFRDQDVVAHGYKHFRSFFTTDGREQSCAEENEVHEDSHGIVRHFKGRRIDIDVIQQYLMNYDRGQDLELWEIRSKDL